MAFHNAYEDYQKLNEKIAQDLFQEKLTLRVYQTPHVAAFDVTLALIQFLAHKPTIGICKNGSSLIDSLTGNWQRLSTPMVVKSQTQSWYEYIESLPLETAFVIWSSENEITGEIMISDKQVVEIHEQLGKKKIFSVQVVHEENFQRSFLLPYAVLISRSSIFARNASVALFGEKCKTPTLMGSFQDLKTVEQDFKFYGYKRAELIESTEKKFTESRQFYFNQFATIPHRLTDRVVFYFPDIAGVHLRQKLGLSAENCFAASQNPFWSLDLWKNWWKEAESEKLIRGLLVVSMTAFEADSLLVKKIEDAVASVRLQSTWTASS